ncbi:hypothetical protein NDU88_007046 [Pleurodeles waltl]|uniref:Uncharacterized protein n=1 Tax=Pleurodeles waltl TaxID=8319 RepID=A0AAV7PKH8_PLEWA|nr:hypothetical protein NDU88_007046 [Pleurodeles waltl]
MLGQADVRSADTLVPLDGCAALVASHFLRVFRVRRFRYSGPGDARPQIIYDMYFRSVRITDAVIRGQKPGLGSRVMQVRGLRILRALC